METLLEIRQHYPQVLAKLEVYLDGGVWRGSDVVKALCLGAKAVGLGRPFLFALSAYGTEGVIRAIQSKCCTCLVSSQFPNETVMSDEIQGTMRLLGVTDINELNESYVNTAMLARDIFPPKL